MHFSLPHIAATDREHPHTISLKLRDMNQLFNSMDPSPFIEKDLDDDAEEFIVSWAQEFSPKAPLKLRIYLDLWPTEDPKELIRTAVHNHFAHRAKITDLEFKRLLRQGRTSLFIGLLFLAACLLLSKMLLGHEAGTWAAVVRESLTIAGWVAMWRPMQIYLYDWWPLLRRSRILCQAEPHARGTRPKRQELSRRHRLYHEWRLRQLVETPAAVNILSFCSLVSRDTRSQIRSEMAQFSLRLLTAPVFR